MKNVTENEDLVFQSILDESYRQYIFPCGSIVRIDNPQCINVSESGGHRIQGCNGEAHYIPSGWIHLTWETKEGKPTFTF